MIMTIYACYRILIGSLLFILFLFLLFFFFLVGLMPSSDGMRENGKQRNPWFPCHIKHGSVCK